MRRDHDGFQTMKPRRRAAGIVGLLLVLLAIWQILAAARGLEITTLRSTAPPLTFVAPQGKTAASRPLVLIAHGFSGSTVVMRGFAFSLAHAGYAVVLWDFRCRSETQTLTTLSFIVQHTPIQVITDAKSSLRTQGF